MISSTVHYLFSLSYRYGTDVSLHLQVTRATLACARPTARRAIAALATSGPKSASLCCGRAKFAPSSARKAPTAWRSSSAATALKDLPARYGKTPPPSPGPGCTCARGSETGGPWKTSRTLGPLRPSGGGVGEGSFLQDLLSCDKGRDADECVPERGGNEPIWWTLSRSLTPCFFSRLFAGGLLIYKPYLSLMCLMQALAYFGMPVLSF